MRRSFLAVPLYVAFQILLFISAPFPDASAKSIADLQYVNGLLDAYKVMETDEPTAGPRYYGFQDDEGAWYIMKETISGDTKTYRYTKGADSFSTNWTGRAALSYDSFQNTF